MDPASAILAFMGMAGGAYYLYNRDLPKDLKDLPKDQNDLPNDLTDLANDQKGLTTDQMNKYFLWINIQNK